MAETKSHDEHDGPKPVAAVKAAHEGHAQSVAKPDLPADFATLFHCVSDPNLPWPKAVLAWGAKSEANQNLLDALRSEVSSNPAGAKSPFVQTLIGEVLKAVKG